MLQTSVNTGCEKKRDAKRETGSNMMVGELDRTQTHVHNNPGHFWVSQFSPLLRYLKMIQLAVLLAYCILCRGRRVIEMKCPPQTCLLVDEACQGSGRVRDCAGIEAACQILSVWQYILYICSVEPSSYSFYIFNFY